MSVVVIFGLLLLLFFFITCFKNALLFIFQRLPSLLTDVCVVYRTFQLPVLEPLTPARLHKMVGVTMACLHVALAVTSAIDNFAPGTSTAPKTGKNEYIRDCFKIPVKHLYGGIILSVSPSRFLLGHGVRCVFALNMEILSVTGSIQPTAGENSASSSSSSIPLAQRSKSVPGTKDLHGLAG